MTMRPPDMARSARALIASGRWPAGVVFSEYWGACSLEIPQERHLLMSDFMQLCMATELLPTTGACFTATDGDACFGAVTWAMSEGVLTNPDWYPGLSASSTFEDFQVH